MSLGARKTEHPEEVGTPVRFAPSLTGGLDKSERATSPPARSLACLTLAAAGTWLVLACLLALLGLLRWEQAVGHLSGAGLLLAAALAALALV